VVAGDALDPFPSARNERHVGASSDEISNEREPQAGGAAGDGHAEAGEGGERGGDCF
jgi:hypothetical protein